MRTLTCAVVVLACVGLALLGCADKSQPLVAPNEKAILGSSAMGLAKPVPLKVALRGKETLGPSSECPILRAELTVQGTGTHLGRFTGVQHDCVDPEHGVFNNGVLDYTAANGDHLFGTYSGFLMPTSDPTVFMVTVDRIDFAGGTGRFVKATGSGTGSGSGNATTGDIVVNIDGTISF